MIFTVSAATMPPVDPLTIHLPPSLIQRRLLSEVPDEPWNFAARAIELALDRRLNLPGEKAKPGPKAAVKKATLGAYIELDLIEWLRSQMRGPQDLGAVVSSILRQAQAAGIVAFPVAK